jgi:ABC-type branched-subunit amino acid transport system substrate-binding protein
MEIDHTLDGRKTMIRKTRIKRTWLAAAVVASGSLLATALPANAETGVSASEIKLGITLPLTGFASPGYSKIGNAMNAYFKYVNDNGGVYGRKVTLIQKNDEYSPQLTIAKTNELILKDKVFALVGPLGTANFTAAHKSVGLARRGVPSLFLNTGFSGFSNKKSYPTSFMVLPSYAMEAKIIAQFLKDNHAGKKLGLVYQNDEFGIDGLGAFKAAGTKFDVTIPYTSGSQSAATAQTWVSQLAAGGAQVVVFLGVTSATGALLGVAAAARYAPQWILGSVGSDPTTLQALGVPVAILNGAQTPAGNPSPSDTSDEYVKQFQEINTKYNANVLFDDYVLQGMNIGLMTVQALRAAGKNLTRKGLVRAMETKGSTFASVAYSPLGFSKTSNVGHTGYYMAVMDANGDRKPFGGKVTLYTTDSGSGPVVVSTFKRPAMPAKGLPSNS